MSKIVSDIEKMLAQGIAWPAIKNILFWRTSLPWPEIVAAVAAAGGCAEPEDF